MASGAKYPSHQVTSRNDRPPVVLHFCYPESKEVPVTSYSSPLVQVEDADLATIRSTPYDYESSIGDRLPYTTCAATQTYSVSQLSIVGARIVGSMEILELEMLEPEMLVAHQR